MPFTTERPMLPHFHRKYGKFRLTSEFTLAKPRLLWFHTQPVSDLTKLF